MLLGTGGANGLAGEGAVLNQTWHLPPASNPPTGKKFMELVADEFGVTAKYWVLGRPMIKIVSLFDSAEQESCEMLYQSDSDYVFDSSKFATAFSFEATSCAEAIKLTTAASR